MTGTDQPSSQPGVGALAQGAPAPGPRLEDLPAPPAGRTGWPWTEETPAAPPRTMGGHPWPRITVVTPSFNQAGFLEETLRSVLLQGYPNLEYIVMDGGSTDGSVEIIERYARWIAHWRSGPDEGQSDAINQGFLRASGDVIGWLNSDDIYCPGALQRAGDGLADGAADMFMGAMDKVLVHDAHVEFVKRSSPHEDEAFHGFPIFKDGRRHGFHFIQPPALWTRELWERTGGLDARYHYQMDREWLTRALAAGARVRTCDDVMARFTLHPGSKSLDFLPRFHQERMELYLRLSKQPEFRTVATLAAALHPMQRVLMNRSGEARENGRTLSWALQGAAGRALKVVRRILPGLGGDWSLNRDPLQGGASGAVRWREGPDIGPSEESGGSER